MGFQEEFGIKLSKSTHKWVFSCYNRIPHPDKISALGGFTRVEREWNTETKAMNYALSLRVPVKFRILRYLIAAKINPGSAEARFPDFFVKIQERPHCRLIVP
jgi:hypothetical protein